MESTTPATYEPARPVAPKKIEHDLPQAPPPSRGRGWIWLVVLAIVGAIAYWQWSKLKTFLPGDTAETKAPTKGGGRRGAGGGTAQVVAVKATKGNIRVYVTGLGAVTPIYTVTVKSRVDGQLMKVMFKEGQLVHQGDLLVDIDPRPYEVQLEQAQGQLIHDQALLKNANLDLERYKTLMKQDAIPEQQLATQEALVTQYQGTIKTDQSQIDSAKLNLVYCHIAAPITGLIGLRLVDPGNIVHASDANGLLVITQLDPISVIFTTAEDQLPPILDRMHAGQQLTVEAWDRELKNKLADGKLETIDNQIDPTTGTLKLRAVFANTNGKLFPSQFVNARLLVQQKQNVTLLPNAGIQRNSQGTYVWLVKPDQTVTVQPITVGTTENDQSEIASGLAPGDTVVTVGVDRLEDGGKVNAQIAGQRGRGGKSGGSSSGGSPTGGGKPDSGRQGKGRSHKPGGEPVS
jgi:membrane fusion protein, multidrug efflux system